MIKNSLICSLIFVFLSSTISIFQACKPETTSELNSPQLSTDIQWQNGAISSDIDSLYFNNIIISQTVDGNPIAIDINTGETLWELNETIYYKGLPPLLIKNDNIQFISYIVDKNQNEKEDKDYYSRIAVDISSGDILWKQNLRRIFNLSPIEDQGILHNDSWYFINMKQEPVFCALDIVTGKIRWEQSLPDINFFPDKQNIHTIIQASPITIHEDTAYLTYVNTSPVKPSKIADITCYAIDLDTGSINWSLIIDGTSQRVSYEAPILMDHVIIILKDDKVYGLEKNTGNILWILDEFPEAIEDQQFRLTFDFDLFSLSEKYLMIAGRYTKDLDPDSLEEYILYLQNEKWKDIYRAIIVEASSGQIKWQSQWYVKHTQEELSKISKNLPLLSSDLRGQRMILLCPLGNIILHAPSKITSFCSITGKEIWQFNIKKDLMQQDLAFGSQFVFISTAKEGRVLAIDLASGEEVWQYQDPGNTRTAPMQIENEMLVLGTQWGRIIALDPSNGEELWKLDLQPQAPITSVQVISAHHMVAINNENTLFMLKSLNNIE